MFFHKIEYIYLDLENNLTRMSSKLPISNDDPLATGIYREGSVIYYYKDGKIHRDDGPAVEHLLSYFVSWYYKGNKIDCTSQEEFEKIIKLLAFI